MMTLLFGSSICARSVMLASTMSSMTPCERGLQEIAVKSKPKRPFRTKAFKGGKLLVQNVDNTAELLAQIEGEAYM